MNQTPTIDPPIEGCVGVTAPQPTTPWPFIEPRSELRLIELLRAAARTQDPAEILVRAAARLYDVILYRAQHPEEPAYQPVDYWLGMALADLAVTGRAAYTKLRQAPVSDASLVAATTARLIIGGQWAPDPAHVAEAAALALDRAYGVAWALRGPLAHQVTARLPLGWIAVSGEDDAPHRPVNVAAPLFQQFEIPVTARGVTVQTRYFIASAVPDAAPAATPRARALPPDLIPTIPYGHQVILFLHGHSSSAEEALAIIPEIHRAGIERGVLYSVVCIDLPNNGYSQRFDHTAIAPSSATTWPGGILDHGPIATPILDYLEDFVVAFVDALDSVAAVKDRFAGVIGGSLGGSLGLRLGRRDLATAPWLAAGIVSWSPASVWTPMVQDVFKSIAPARCQDLWDAAETGGSRADYFVTVYDKNVSIIIPHTQPDFWYRDDWQPCKSLHIRESRAARQEIYDAAFRRWHWRVAGEQLVFSHVDRVDHEDATTPRRYEQNRVRQLLVAGAQDNYTGSGIFDATRQLAAWMVSTPGRSLFLNDTGHSIHAERPRFLAGEIVSFLLEGQSARTSGVVFLAPLLLDEPARVPCDLGFLVPLLLGERS